MQVPLIIQLMCAVGIKCQMEGKVVYGDPVDISRFPYSAFLFITSRDNNFICGSSIINQRILLTAAHCIEVCVKNLCTSGHAFIGDADFKKGKKMPLKGFIMHEHFDHDLQINDIGLVAVQGTVKFGEFVKRVAILKKPLNFKVRVAAVAGWGLIDDMHNIQTHYLHTITQKIWPLEECRKVIKIAPNGTFCSGELHGHQYASVGDSGSALVVDGYVQLGLVSFTRPEYTSHIVFYTHVPLFYNWIKRNTRKLYCHSNN